MADDKTIRGLADRSRINIHEDFEVDYWARKFSCRPSRLRAAVLTVGTSPQAVEHWLTEHR
jgi:hypothetical protein